jgi:hypothetical protein
MPKVRRLRVSNPHKRRRSKSSRRSNRRRNSAEVLIVANPKKRRTRRSRSRARTRKNPFRISRKSSFRRRHSRRRSNPGIAGFNTNELLKLALGAAAGGLGSKYLAQVALGDKNSGAMGYAGNAVATLAIAWAAHRFVGKDAATGVVAGGLGALVMRYFTENISGTSSSMSGLGDPDMAALGIGMGDYRYGQSLAVPGQWSSPPPPVAIAAGGRRRG